MAEILLSTVKTASHMAINKIQSEKKKWKQELIRIIYCIGVMSMWIASEADEDLRDSGSLRRELKVEIKQLKFIQYRSRYILRLVRNVTNRRVLDGISKGLERIHILIKIFGRNNAETVLSDLIGSQEVVLSSIASCSTQPDQVKAEAKKLFSGLTRRACKQLITTICGLKGWPWLSCREASCIQRSTNVMHRDKNVNACRGICEHRAVHRSISELRECLGKPGVWSSVSCELCKMDGSGVISPGSKAPTFDSQSVSVASAGTGKNRWTAKLDGRTVTVSRGQYGLEEAATRFLRSEPVVLLGNSEETRKLIMLTGHLTRKESFRATIGIYVCGCIADHFRNHRRIGRHVTLSQPNDEDSSEVELEWRGLGVGYAYVGNVTGKVIVEEEEGSRPSTPVKIVRTSPVIQESNTGAETTDHTVSTRYNASRGGIKRVLSAAEKAKRSFKELVTERNNGKATFSMGEIHVAIATQCDTRYVKSWNKRIRDLRCSFCEVCEHCKPLVLLCAAKYVELREKTNGVERIAYIQGAGLMNKLHGSLRKLINAAQHMQVGNYGRRCARIEELDLIWRFLSRYAFGAETCVRYTPDMGDLINIDMVVSEVARAKAIQIKEGKRTVVASQQMLDEFELEVPIFAATSEGRLNTGWTSKENKTHRLVPMGWMPHSPEAAVEADRDQNVWVILKAKNKTNVQHLVCKYGPERTIVQARQTSAEEILNMCNAYTRVVIDPDDNWSSSIFQHVKAIS